MAEKIINTLEDLGVSDANKVDWFAVSRCKKLSESFIEKFADKVDWWCISKYQKLSETFIEKFSDKVFWSCISDYQLLSDEFIKRHSDKLCIPCIKDSWLYKSTEFKKKAVIDTGMYECHDDYFIAYKGIRSDRYSNFNFQYQYLPGETYETHADYSADECSFGFSAWDYNRAKDYCPELVVKVKIYYEDVARILTEGNVRCSKITVLN